jgi:DNA-binding CsgD family transcriptional regulator
MSKSQCLRLRDVRNVFRLVGECREFGTDPAGWRLHLLRGAGRLTGAQVGIGGELQLTPDGPQPIGLVDTGWADEEQRAAFRRYQEQGRLAADHLFAKYVKLLQHDGRTTRTRTQVIPDSEWYRSDHFNEYIRVSGIDDSLVSLHAPRHLPAGSVSMIIVYRRLGDRSFDQRGARVIHLLHQELSPLIGRQLASRRDPSAADLAPRVRQTLQCLLEGDSAKQVARRLGISRETVNHYVKTLYRHFGVHSRAELLARYLRKGT